MREARQERVRDSGFELSLCPMREQLRGMFWEISGPRLGRVVDDGEGDRAVDIEGRLDLRGERQDEVSGGEDMPRDRFRVFDPSESPTRAWEPVEGQEGD